MKPHSHRHNLIKSCITSVWIERIILSQSETHRSTTTKITVYEILRDTTETFVSNHARSHADRSRQRLTETFHYPSIRLGDFNEIPLIAETGVSNAISVRRSATHRTSLFTVFTRAEHEKRACYDRTSCPSSIERSLTHPARTLT